MISGSQRLRGQNQLTRRVLPAVCVRWLAFSCVLLVLCSVSAARAAAPMCDHLAQTIAAPAPLKPIPDRKLASTRCSSDVLERVDSVPAPRERSPQLHFDVVQRVLPVSSTVPLDSPSMPERIPLERERRVVSAFPAEIYRPPRF